MGLQLSMYMEKIQYLPKGISPPGFSVEGVRGRDNVDWLGDILLSLGNFHPGFLEEGPWLLSGGAGEGERLKTLLIESRKEFFSESLELCELSFAMLTMVRDNELSCCSADMRLDMHHNSTPDHVYIPTAKQERLTLSLHRTSLVFIPSSLHLLAALA
jgi:hypothetical protein